MSRLFKEQVVNDAIVLDYSAEEFAEYLKKKAQSIKYEANNALNGLRIMDVSVISPHALTRSPIESGVYISDCKVRFPTKITIKGICDNVRGELNYDREKVEQRQGIIGGKIAEIAYGVSDAVFGFDFSADNVIKTRARSVYKKIHQMLNDKTSLYGKPKTWYVSTKGAVYPNMILKDVEQLNDWEHLMVVPVILHFEELMMTGQDGEQNVCLSDDDSALVMGGSMKKASIFEDPKGNLKSAASFII